MARYTGPVCKLCRREGQKLFLKGARCYQGTCAVERRSYAPGQHGQAHGRKPNPYGIQLRAKQVARRYYGLSESQFRKYFDMAARVTGVTGDQMLQFCESRLDNVVYSLGWGSSRAEARQLVTHGHFEVNGKKVDIPSFLVHGGEIISIKEKSRASEKIKALAEGNGSRPVPPWLERSREAFEGKVLNLPTREQIYAPVEEHLIVEFYSR